MTTIAALLRRNLLLLFFVSLAIGNALSANPIPKTQPKLPERLPEGVCVIDGEKYTLRWNGDHLRIVGVVAPWTADGWQVGDELRVWWHYQTHHAVGRVIYRRDGCVWAGGYWTNNPDWKSRSVITPPAEPSL